MDYDHDGSLDFVSGSYSLGEVFLFRALGKGKFEPGRMLFDAGGVPLVHHPARWVEMQQLGKQKDRDAYDAAVLANYGSFPMPVDFDADGVLDMLIGSLGGQVFLREGIARDKKARKAGKGPFSPVAVPIEAGGETLAVHSHADPFAADWDGDGLWDLVVGAGDGSVGWYRNQGTKQAPRFAARVELVASRSSSNLVERTVDADGQPLPAARAQICVADLDGDGRAELLVGDFAKPGASSKTRTSYIWLYRRPGPITPR